MASQKRTPAVDGKIKIKTTDERIKQRDGLILRLLKSPFFPQLIMLSLIVIPYFMYERSKYKLIGLFLIRPIYTNGQHFIVSACIFAIVVCSTYFAIQASKVSRNSFYELNKNSIYVSTFGKIIILFFVSVSIIAHLYLLATSGRAYVSGGLLEARAEIANGVGIFLRFYMFSLPLAFIAFRGKILPWALVGIFFVLIAARIVVISERMAVFEFIAVLILIVRVRNINVKISHALLALLGIYAAFSAIVEVRLMQQNSSNAKFVGRGASRTDLSTIAYYADTINKAYYASVIKIDSAQMNWTTPVRVIFGGRQMDTAYQQSIVSSGNTSSELNNPGGVALDVEDFGVVGAAAALIIKTFLSTIVLERARHSLVAFAIFPLIYIRILEYPRFEYLYLPYAFIVFLTAIFFAIIISLFVARRRIEQMSREGRRYITLSERVPRRTV